MQVEILTRRAGVRFVRISRESRQSVDDSDVSSVRATGRSFWLRAEVAPPEVGIEFGVIIQRGKEGMLDAEEIG